jgi:hypothetical protein
MPISELELKNPLEVFGAVKTAVFRPFVRDIRSQQTAFIRVRTGS